jgi:hypothetical protein
MSRYDPDYVKMIVSQRHKEMLREAEQSRLLKATQHRGPGRRWTWTFRAMASRPAEWSSRLRCLARGYLAGTAGTVSGC